MTVAARVDVVVVGAGMAGLACATTLVEAGCSVAVLEAGARIGGRVRTVHDRFVGGQHAESGAEWVDADHHRVLALLDRHGLAPEPHGQVWRHVRRWFHLGGALQAGADVAGASGLAAEFDRYDALVAREAGRILDPGHPTQHPEAAVVDGRSIASAIDDADLGPVARLVVTRAAQGEFAAEADDVSLLFLAQQRALAGGAEVSAHRVAGGLSALPVALAAGLGDRVVPRTPVVEVEHGAGEVAVVAADGRVWEAGAVVLACSLVPLRRVRFVPALPSVLVRAVHELGYGTVTKTAVQYRTRCWPAGYLLSDGPLQRLYEPTEGQDGTEGILMAYQGGDGGRAAGRRASEADRVEWVVAEASRVHACTAGQALGGFSRAWAEEPRYGGAYAVYQPGQVTEHWEVLRRPYGSILLAGEHTATVTGYVEGAVESGERAAGWYLSGA